MSPSLGHTQLDSTSTLSSKTLVHSETVFLQLPKQRGASRRRSTLDDDSSTSSAHSAPAYEKRQSGNRHGSYTDRPSSVTSALPGTPRLSADNRELSQLTSLVVCDAGTSGSLTPHKAPSISSISSAAPVPDAPPWLVRQLSSNVNQAAPDRCSSAPLNHLLSTTSASSAPRRGTSFCTTSKISTIRYAAETTPSANDWNFFIQLRVPPSCIPPLLPLTTLEWSLVQRFQRICGEGESYCDAVLRVATVKKRRARALRAQRKNLLSRQASVALSQTFRNNHDAYGTNCSTTQNSSSASVRPRSNFYLPGLAGVAAWFPKWPHTSSSTPSTECRTSVPPQRRRGFWDTRLWTWFTGRRVGERPSARSGTPASQASPSPSWNQYSESLSHSSSSSLLDDLSSLDSADASSSLLEDDTAVSSALSDADASSEESITEIDSRDQADSNDGDAVNSLDAEPPDTTIYKLRQATTHAPLSSPTSHLVHRVTPRDSPGDAVLAPLQSTSVSSPANIRQPSGYHPATRFGPQEPLSRVLHHSRSTISQMRALRRLQSGFDLLENRVKLLRCRTAPIVGDGNCQFRAASMNLYGTEDYHAWVRHNTVAHMCNLKSRYQPFFPDSSVFAAYLLEMSRDATWGDELTIRAVADCFQCAVHIITSKRDFWYLRYNPQNADETPVYPRRHLFFSYISPVHYNAFFPIVPPLP